MTSVDSNSGDGPMTPTTTTITSPNSNINPIFNYFNLKRNVGSCGPEMLWKIYDATRIQDMKTCSIFLFEKKLADKLHKPRRREVICSVLRRDVKTMQIVKHPRVLQVIHPIEENNDSLCFATEHVLGSLANILGNTTRCQSMPTNEIKNFYMSDLVRVHGILQLTEILRYLHTSVRVIHGNICPSSILITPKGHWKLASMPFLQQIPQLSNANNDNLNLKIEFGPSPWNKKLPKMARPVIEYMAPECLYAMNHVDSTTPINNQPASQPAAEFGMRPGPWSDMYSLGMLICSMYANQPAENSLLYLKKETSSPTHSPNCSSTSSNDIMNKSPTSSCSNSNKAIFASSSITMSEISRIQNTIKSNEYPDILRSTFEMLPIFFIEPLEKMLCRTLKRRPSSQMFSLLKIFNEAQVICYDGLLSFDSKGLEDRNKNISLLKTLYNTYSREFLMRNIFNLLLDAFSQIEELFPESTLCYKSLSSSDFSTSNTNNSQSEAKKIVSPSLLGRSLASALANIINLATVSEYSKYLQDKALRPFRMTEKIQIQSFLLSNVEQFTKHATYDEIRFDVLPIAFKCLESNSSEVQIAALDAMKSLITYCETSVFKDILWPKCKNAIIRGLEKPRLQRSATNCLCEIIPVLSDRTISEEIVPFLLDLSTEFLALSRTVDVQLSDSNLKGQTTTYNLSLFSSSPKNIVESCYTVQIICRIWMKLIEQKPEVLDSKLIAVEIFPSLLPHVVNQYMKHIEFRALIQVLYGLLDILDSTGTNSGSEDSTENLHYQVYPAVTTLRRNSQTFSREPFSRQQLENLHSPSNQAFVKVLNETRRSNHESMEKFSPMIHPNLLRQSNSNMSRRATASVICPLPIQDDSVLDDSYHHRYSNAGMFDSNDKNDFFNSKMNLFNLKIPSISVIRRYSGEQNTSNTDIPRSSGSITNLLKSSPLTTPRGSLNNAPLQNRDLLTARVSEGPFVSAPSSRSSSRRPSNIQATPKLDSLRKISFLSPNPNMRSNHRSSYGNLANTVMSLINQAKSPS